MRHLLIAAALAASAGPALAAGETGAQGHAAGDGETGRATAAEQPAAGPPRRCLPAHAVVPPFNNSPEALDQARVAATMIAGEAVCQTSAVSPELSQLKHGAEEPVLPDDAAVPEGTQVAQNAADKTPNP